MGMPSVYAVGLAASGLGAVTPGIPTGTDANDVLILLMESDPVLDPAAIGAVTGYAEVLNSPSSQTGGLPTRLTVRWHRATGAESGTVSVPDAGNHVVARIIGFRGCVTSGDPWNQTAASLNNTTATAVSIDGLTTTAADCMILSAFTTGQDVALTTNVIGWANASLTNVAERVDDWSAAGTGGGIGAATGEKATAGAVAATTATLTTGNFKAQFCMALQGAVAAAGSSGGKGHGSRLSPSKLQQQAQATNW
jgi:hypothetical protein